MPSRNVMDNRINAQENQTQAAQNAGRGTGQITTSGWVSTGDVPPVTGG